MKNRLFIVMILGIICGFALGQLVIDYLKLRKYSSNHHHKHDHPIDDLRDIFPEIYPKHERPSIKVEEWSA